MLNECNRSLLSAVALQFRAKARGLSWMFTTNRIELRGISLTCLYGFVVWQRVELRPFVLGDLVLLKARDRFLHTSSVSLNRNSINESPRPLRLSVSSVTSHRDTKCRCDDTRWGCVWGMGNWFNYNVVFWTVWSFWILTGQLSISLNMSNIASWPSVLRLSSLM